MIQNEEKIVEISKKFIDFFDENAKVELEETNGSFRLNITSEIAPFLIGKGGETLKALEHLLRIVIAGELGEYTPLIVDVSGYRAARENEIAERARSVAEKVLSEGKDIELQPMNGYERRLVHLALEEIEGIEVGSVGVEPERRIVIRKK